KGACIMFRKSLVARLGTLLIGIQLALANSGSAAPPASAPRTVARKPSPASVSTSKGHPALVHKSAGGTSPPKVAPGKKANSRTGTGRGSTGTGQGNRGNGTNTGSHNGSSGKKTHKTDDVPLEPLHPQDGERKVLDPDHPGYY